MKYWMIFSVVLLVAGCGKPATEGGSQPVASQGAKLYSMHCLACHQRDGGGLGEANPALRGSTVVSGDPVALVRWVARGVRPEGMAARRAVVVMPQYTWLSDDDLAAVLSYVRAEFGSGAAAISATEVAQARAP